MQPARIDFVRVDSVATKGLGKDECFEYV